MKTPVALIAAVSDNGVIGVDGGMPWHISSDMKYFRAMTLGKPIIMGRKQYESVGKPLDRRPNIVISRRQGLTIDGVLVVSSVPEALRLADRLARESGAKEMMIIGGGEVYAQTFASADRLYITHVHKKVRGDVMFPVIDFEVWRVMESERVPGPPIDCTRTTYVRAPAGPARSL